MLIRLESEGGEVGGLNENIHLHIHLLPGDMEIGKEEDDDQQDNDNSSH